MKKAVIISLVIFLGFMYIKTGFYSVQPLNAFPQGATVWVWRNADEPFFNSPDAMSIQKTGGVSMASRAAAIISGPKSDRIIFKLPYIEFAYKASVDWQQFGKNRN